MSYQVTVSVQRPAFTTPGNVTHAFNILLPEEAEWYGTEMTASIDRELEKLGWDKTWVRAVVSPEWEESYGYGK